jgi:hypothetical protein
MWRLRTLGRDEWLAIALVVGFLGVAGFASLQWRWLRQSQFGFGPGWHCTYPGKGGPICIKDPPASN